MSLKPVPPGFSIAFRGQKKRWTWKQNVKPKSDDDVLEAAGFTKWMHARDDLDNELARRRKRDAQTNQRAQGAAQPG